MKRFLLAAIAALAIGLPAHAQFDFRTTGTRSARRLDVTCTPTSAPAVSAANMASIFVPCAGIGGYSAGNVYISQNTGPWTLLSSFVGSGAVTSVFSRTGAITAQQADYDGFFLTPAEGNAAYVAALGASIDSELVLWSGTTGKAVKRATGTGLPLVTSGVLSLFTTSAGLSGALSDETGSGALVFGTSPTIVTPTIASFANAAHNHTNAAGGGQLTDAALSSAVTAAKGGTGISTAASTGVPRIAAGTWTIDANLSHLASSTSAQLAGVLSDETGSGALVFATSPVLGGNVGIGAAADMTLRAGDFGWDGANLMVGRTPGIAGANYERIRAFVDTSNATVISEFAGTGASRPLKLSTQGGASLTLGSTATFSTNVSSSGTYTESSRSAAIGYWTAFTPTLGASAGTLSCSTTSAARYMLVGKSMTVTLTVSGCTVSATPANFTLTIPAGATAAASTGGTFSYSDNGAAGQTGWVRSIAASSSLSLYRSLTASPVWSTASATTQFSMTYTFEIQ